MQLQYTDNDGELLNIDDAAVDDVLYYAADDYDRPLKLNFEIPRDPQTFLRHFGGLVHPRFRDENNLPLRVNKLAPYQVSFWEMDKGVLLGSNKIGKTTSESLGDFQSRLFPEYAGFDVLFQAQNQKMANEHVLDLKKIVLNSPRYNQFVIKRPDFEILKEEKTKVGVMYVRNPYNPRRPSRIIGIGASEALAYSWKNVNRLHISDPSLLKMKKQDDFFGGLFSRLANTDGQIKIEGVPKYRIGWFWKLCRKLFGIRDEYEENLSDFERMVHDEDDIPDEIVNVFQKLKITIDDAVAEGIISENYRKTMKMTLPPAKYRNLFMCEFIRPEGAAFSGSFEVGEHPVEDWG